MSAKFENRVTVDGKTFSQKKTRSYSHAVIMRLVETGELHTSNGVKEISPVRNYCGSLKLAEKVVAEWDVHTRRRGVYLEIVPVEVVEL